MTKPKPKVEKLKHFKVTLTRMVEQQQIVFVDSLDEDAARDDASALTRNDQWDTLDYRDSNSDVELVEDGEE